MSSLSENTIETGVRGHISMKENFNSSNKERNPSSSPKPKNPYQNTEGKVLPFRKSSVKSSTKEASNDVRVSHLLEPVDSEGNTPFMLVAESGDLKSIKSLTTNSSAKPGVNRRNIKGSTAIILASRNGYSDVVAYLLSEFPDLDLEIQNFEGKTALMIASEFGRIDVVKAIIFNSKTVNVELKDVHGFTALMLAAFGGHKELVQLLVSEAKANVDTFSKVGYTALMYTIKFGYNELFEYFVSEAKANADLYNLFGKNAFMLALNEERDDMASYLIDHANVSIDCEDRGFAMKSLRWAICNDFGKIVKFLLEKVDSIADFKDDNGMTGLMWAVKTANKDIVELIVTKHLSDVNT